MNGRTIKYLALQGGGVWGIAYAGAFEALDELGYLAEIEQIAGTSAGSIFGLLLSLRYTPGEIKDIILDLDFSKFEDDGSMARVTTRYGYYKGKFALELFESWIETKLGNKLATFADLKDIQGRDLRAYATNLDTRKIHEFSYRKTPQVPMALAVRASMSIPLIFRVAEVDEQLFVDGGLVMNYPILSFGQEALPHALGLGFAESAVTPEKRGEFDRVTYNEPVHYLRALIEALQMIQSPVYLINDGVNERTITIETSGIASIDFNLSSKQRDLLIENGRGAVYAYFNVPKNAGETEVGKT